jgi:hypothetical protein
VVFPTRVLEHLYDLLHEQWFHSAGNFTVDIAARVLANSETNNLSSAMNSECYIEFCVDKGNPINHITSVPF